MSEFFQCLIDLYLNHFQNIFFYLGLLFIFLGIQAFRSSRRIGEHQVYFSVPMQEGELGVGELKKHEGKEAEKISKNVRGIGFASALFGVFWLILAYFY